MQVINLASDSRKILKVCEMRQGGLVVVLMHSLPSWTIWVALEADVNPHRCYFTPVVRALMYIFINSYLFLVRTVSWDSKSLITWSSLGWAVFRKNYRYFSGNLWHGDSGLWMETDKFPLNSVTGFWDSDQWKDEIWNFFLIQSEHKSKISAMPFGLNWGNENILLHRLFIYLDVWYSHNKTM